jgi:hypothetical protein
MAGTSFQGQWAVVRRNDDKGQRLLASCTVDARDVWDMDTARGEAVASAFGGTVHLVASVHRVAGKTA